MDLSIIIVNYNTANLILGCINSIKENTEGCSYEIIVVDNASNDNVDNVLTDDIKLIKSNENLGFGKANNLGAQYANGKYLFLLNGDTLLLNNAVGILFNYLEANENVAVVGGNLFSIDKKPMHSYSLQMPSLKTIFCWEILPYRLYGKYNHKNYEFNTTNTPIEVKYITGADMMIRQEVFAEVGGFDKDFFMYCEESELSNRILKKGYKIVNVPDAEIIHLEGASLSTKSDFNEKRYRMMNTESQFLFYEKVYGEKYVKKYVKYKTIALRLKRRRDIFYKDKIKIIRDGYKKWYKNKKEVLK